MNGQTPTRFWDSILAGLSEEAVPDPKATRALCPAADDIIPVIPHFPVVFFIFSGYTVVGVCFMINSITLDNFRGLRHLELPDLPRLTLLTGMNNAGKSSVLEGIFLYLDHGSPDCFHKLYRMRGMHSSNLNQIWGSAFFQMDTSIPILIAAKEGTEQFRLRFSRTDSDASVGFLQTPAPGFPVFSGEQDRYSIQYAFHGESYTEDGLFFRSSGNSVQRSCKTNLDQNRLRQMTHCLYVSSMTAAMDNDAALSEWYGNMLFQGKKQGVLKALRIIEPGISEITTIVRQEQPQLFLEIDHTLVPLKMAGEGVVRMLYIILGIMNFRGAVILLDEITTGIHYSVLPKFWEKVAVAAGEYDSQIIATTHSYECIEAAVEGVENAGMMDDFCLYRIERAEDGTRPVQYSGSLLRTAVNGYMEVR